MPKNRVIVSSLKEGQYQNGMQKLHLAISLAIQGGRTKNITTGDMSSFFRYKLLMGDQKRQDKETTEKVEMIE